MPRSNRRDPRRACCQRVAVFIRAALSFFAVRLLNARTHRHDWFGRRRAHPLGHQLDQQRFLVRHPLHLVVEHGVEADAGHLMTLPRLGIPNPELHRFGRDIRERKALSIGGSTWARPGTRRREAQHEFARHPRCAPVRSRGAGRDAVAAGRIVLAVIPGLNPHAGKAQERRRHPGNRGVILPRHQENRVVRRAHLGHGR